MMHWLKSDWSIGILPSSDDIDPIQVPERNSDIDMMSGYYFHILASSWDKLESLHQGADWHDKNCQKAFYGAD